MTLPKPRAILVLLSAALMACRATPAQNPDTAQSRIALSHGGSSRPRSNPCPVVGYVIEGALRTPVRFLAYFTCDRETPLSVPVLESQQVRRSGTDR